MKKILILSFFLNLNFSFGQYTGNATIYSYWTGIAVGNVYIETFDNNDTTYLVGGVQIDGYGLGITHIYISDGMNHYDLTSARGGKYKKESGDDFYTKESGPKKYFVKVLYDYLSLEDAVSVGEVTIYPNPATDFIIINVNSQEATSVLLTDIHGNKIISERMSETFRIDLADQPRGIYLLTVGDVVRKIVKQ